MATTKDVADWMFAQLQTTSYLYQETVVYKIKSQFGPGFVYNNENGNLAIGKDVLKEFRKLTDGKVIWERSEKAWRKVRPTEKYKGRQVE